MSLIDNIGLGCVSLSTLPFEKTALKILNTAFEAGITHFDTAPLYGNGYSEKIVGKFLKTKRNKISITTKFGLSPKNPKQIPVWMALPLNSIKKKLYPIPNNYNSFQAPVLIDYRKIDLSDIQNSFENSVKNLQVKYIDYYFLHEGLPFFLTDEAMKYLEILKKNGDVGNVGIATSQINIKQLKADNCDFWDILQYENGSSYHPDDLINIYPNQRHFYHSIFKSSAANNIKPDYKNNINGMLLARSIYNNPKGKVLFGTSNINHLNINLKALDNCNKMDISLVNKSIENAFN